jgi:uncharacterized protein (TIGR03790 family)
VRAVTRAGPGSGVCTRPGNRYALCKPCDPYPRKNSSYFVSYLPEEPDILSTSCGTYLKAALTATLLMLTVSPCAGLQPDEVAVIANGADETSVVLARYYMGKRGIPTSNLIVVKTDKGYILPRTRYEAEIVTPLREALAQRGLAQKIKCLCLIRGIPTRVEGDTADSSPSMIRLAFRKGVLEARNQLVDDYLRLGTVARAFPPAPDSDLEPVENLFGAVADSKPTRKWLTKDVLRNIASALAQKQRDIRLLSDPQQQRIAYRQMMALHLRAHGLNGLIRYVQNSRPPGAPDVANLRLRLAAATEKLQELARPRGAEEVKRKLGVMRETDGLVAVCTHGQAEAAKIRLPNDDAALDSDLALLWVQAYPLSHRLPNQLHWRVAAENRLRPGEGNKQRPPVLMTARLDGPTPEDVRRIIDDSARVEQSGLEGIVYIDAGASPGLMGKKDNSPYRDYDMNLKRLHSFLKANTSMNVILDRGPSLFSAGQCPQAALYIGWYSLKKYIPAFTWQPGSVGWHIASYEAVSLRSQLSEEWCPSMIRNGVSATLGAVNEPYVSAFPRPDEFFPLLLTGKYTLAECYWLTVPDLSWRILLIGDPLYRPFAANPQVDVSALPASLAPRTGVRAGIRK